MTATPPQKLSELKTTTNRRRITAPSPSELLTMLEDEPLSIVVSPPESLPSLPSTNGSSLSPVGVSINDSKRSELQKERDTDCKYLISCNYCIKVVKRCVPSNMSRETTGYIELPIHDRLFKGRKSSRPTLVKMAKETAQETYPLVKNLDRDVWVMLGPLELISLLDGRTL